MSSLIRSIRFKPEVIDSNFFLDKVSEDLNRAEIAPKKEEKKAIEASPPKNEEAK